MLFYRCCIPDPICVQPPICTIDPRLIANLGNRLRPGQATIYSVDTQGASSVCPCEICCVWHTPKLFYYCAYYDHCVQGFKSPGLIIFFWFGPFAGRVSTLSRSVNVCRFAWCRPPASTADPSRDRLPPETTPTLSLAWVERAVVSTRGWPKFDGQPLGSWSAAFLGSCPVPAVSQ